MCVPEGERERERERDREGRMAVEATMVYNMNPVHHQEYPFSRDLYPNYNNNVSKQEVDSHFLDTQTPYSYAYINHHFDDIHQPQPHVATDWNHIWCSSSSPPLPLPQLDLDIVSNDHTIPTIPIISSSSLSLNHEQHHSSTSPSPSLSPQNLNLVDISNSNSNTNRTPKRRRGKARKNKEEMETQRMTHIAVERNRRKQMNDYLYLLRSLMPPSYVQRGDQASIIGGAINFVKELEQRLQFLGAHNIHKKKCEKEEKEEDEEEGGEEGCIEIPKMPFSEFFSFPQYSMMSSSSMGDQKNIEVNNNNYNNNAATVEVGVGDIEVTMVESHANVKIRSKKRPKQLFNIVSALHSMHLTILHLNLTTTSDFVLYSISLKIEEECKLGSVDEIAAALHQMLQRIQHHSSSPMLNNQHPNFN